MGASKDLFIRISEEDYFNIPEGIRQSHLQSKIYSQSKNDFEHLMKDSHYAKLHKTYKKAKKELEEREYQIRENNRKNN